MKEKITLKCDECEEVEVFNHGAHPMGVDDKGSFYGYHPECYGMMRLLKYEQNE